MWKNGGSTSYKLRGAWRQQPSEVQMKVITMTWFFLKMAMQNVKDTTTIAWNTKGMTSTQIANGTITIAWNTKGTIEVQIAKGTTIVVWSTKGITTIEWNVKDKTIAT
jgi:hypothetical protein